MRPPSCAVVAVVETLQVHFVEIHPGAQVFEHLRRAVAVGDEAGDEPRRFGLLENGDGPLAGDQGFVVGADQNLRALLEGVRDHSPGVTCMGRETAWGSRRACDVTQFWQ